jgi:predicted permease
MAEEFRHHIELRTEDLVRRGVPAAEASRRAHLEFGHVETHREAAQVSRGLRLFDQVRFSWVDFKLGVRMLVKHPGLTLVASFALAVGIPVGMAPVHLSNALEAPLPEDRDDRVRAIRHWDPASGTAESPSYRDFELLREKLTTFANLGAFRSSSYNVASGSGPAAPVAGAEVTASSFEVLGTRPLLGRTLAPRDEALGAPEVVVLGHDLWRSRFGGDPDLVGRVVHVGAVPHTVVGVMPDGFLFPVRQQLWVPLRERPGGGPGSAREGSPKVRIFGLVQDGASTEQVQAELGAMASRLFDDAPEAPVRLRPQVVPFGIAHFGLPRRGLEEIPEFYYLQVLALTLLLVACANVAMLVFALTATRFRELAVRTALGASRARIVSQIFAETLVLAVCAAGVGLFGIDWILRQVRAAVVARGLDLPYWLSLEVTGEAVLWGLLLAVVSATVAGVVPALKLTGTKIQQSIKKAEAGRSGIRFGGLTSVLIVADVALAVSVSGVALALGGLLWHTAKADELTGIPADEYLAAEVRLPGSELRAGTGGAATEGTEARLAGTQRRLVERLEEEPGVRGVAVASGLPRMDHRSRLLEIEGIEESASTGGWQVRTVLVDVGFFTALRQPILAGRGFDRADVARQVPPILVNTVFVDRLLRGRAAVGSRVRFVSPEGGEGAPWHEIVGVVEHLGMKLFDPQGDPGVYVPAPPGAIHPIQLGIHLRDDPESFAPRLREILTEVDPAAVLGRTVALDRVFPGDWYVTAAIVGGLGLLVAILIALGASGLYAILSFSVSERRREIGIRTALGASRSAVVLTVLRRSLVQIVAGALLGLPIAARLLYEFGEAVGRETSPAVPLLAGLGFTVGIVAVIGGASCVAPVRRALGVDPNTALRAEG